MRQLAANNFLFVKDQSGVIVDAVKLESYQDGTLSDVPSRWIVMEQRDIDKPLSSWNMVCSKPKRLLLGYTFEVGTRKQRDEWIVTRVSPGYKDLAGVSVERGARVAVAFALGRGAEIRIGKVVGFDLLLSGYGTTNFDYIDGREQIVVEWENSNKAYGDTPETSKIFAGLRRYVVIR